MKKIALLAAAGTCLIAAPAMASDEDNWTGAYVGVSAGYNSTSSKTATTLGGNWSTEAQALRDFVTSRSASNMSVKAANIGAQIGYNAQIGEMLVVGAEADAALLTGKTDYVRGPLSYSTTPALGYTFTNRIDPKSSYAVKAKLGVAMGPTLLYATGGWGWTRAGLGADIVSTAGYKKTASLNHTYDGFVVGGGIEHKFAPNISARLDYTYTDQGDFSYPTSYVTGSTSTTPAYGETISQNLKMHQVRVGVNFHF